MPYKKTTWKNHETKLNETNLNNMEEGIATANQKAEANEDNITEIRNASQKVSVSFDNANKDLVIKVGDDSTPNVKSEHRTNIPVMSQNELNETLAEHTEGLKEYIASKVTGFYKPAGSVNTKADLITPVYISPSVHFSEENKIDTDKLSETAANYIMIGYNVYAISNSLTAISGAYSIGNHVSVSLGDKIYILIKVNNIPNGIDIESISPATAGINFTDTFKISDDTILICGYKASTSTMSTIRLKLPLGINTIEDLKRLTVKASIYINSSFDVEDDTAVAFLNSYFKNTDEINNALDGAAIANVDKRNIFEQRKYEIGSTVNVLDTGMNYTWTGTEWDPLGSEPIKIISDRAPVDLRNFENGIYYNLYHHPVSYVNIIFPERSLIFFKFLTLSKDSLDLTIFEHATSNLFIYKINLSNNTIVYNCIRNIKELPTYVNAGGYNINYNIYVPTNPGTKGQVLVSDYDYDEDEGHEPVWKNIEDILPEGIGGGTTQQIVSASKNKPYNCDIQIDDMWIKYPKNNIQKKCNKNTPPFGFHNLSDIEYFAQNNKNNVYDELVNNCSEPITMDNTYVIIKTKPISLELAEYIRNSDEAFINKNKPLSKHIYLILNFPTKRNLKKNLVSDTTNKTISVKERNKRKDLSHGDGHRSYFNFVHFNNKVFNLPEFSRSSVNSELIQTTNFRISLQDVKTSHHGICWIEKRISLRQLCIALFGNQINNETFSNLRNTFNEFFSLYSNAYQFMNSFPCMQYYYDFSMPYPDKIFYLTNSQTNRTNLTKENIGWNICMYKKRTLVFDPKYRTDFLMTLCGDYMNSGTTGAFKLNNKYLRTTDNVCLAHNAELKNGTSAYNVSRYIYGSDHSVPEFANFTLKALTTAVCEPQFVLVQGTHSYVDGASKLTGADKYEAREDDNAIIHRYSKPNRTISIRLKNTSRFDDRSYSYEYFMSVCSLRITKK